MNLLPAIQKGKAIIQDGGLRCGAFRAKDETRRCNKLLARLSAGGQIAGNFRCERCKQEIEVELVRAQSPARS